MTSHNTVSNKSLLFYMTSPPTHQLDAAGFLLKFPHGALVPCPLPVASGRSRHIHKSWRLDLRIITTYLLIRGKVMTSQRTLHIYIYMSDCPHAVLLLKFETLKNNKATSKNQIQQETPSTIWILDSTSLSSSLLFMLPSTFLVCTQFKDLSSVGSGNWLAPEGKGLSSFSKTFLGFEQL